MFAAFDYLMTVIIGVLCLIVTCVLSIVVVNAARRRTADDYFSHSTDRLSGMVYCICIIILLPIAFISGMTNYVVIFSWGVNEPNIDKILVNQYSNYVYGYLQYFYNNLTIYNVVAYFVIAIVYTAIVLRFEIMVFMKKHAVSYFKDRGDFDGNPLVNPDHKILSHFLSGYGSHYYLTTVGTNNYVLPNLQKHFPYIGFVFLFYPMHFINFVLTDMLRTITRTFDKICDSVGSFFYNTFKGVIEWAAYAFFSK